MTRRDIVKLFEKYGKVNEKQLDSIDYVMNKLGKTLADVDLDDVKSYLEYTDNVVEYRNEKGEVCHPNLAKYRWVSTGIHDRDDILCMAFMRREGEMDFESYYVATIDKLERSLFEFLGDLDKKASDKKKENKSYKDLADEIYGSLLMKECWEKLDDNRLLINAVKQMEAKIRNEMSKGENLNFEYNNTKNQILYNTGLIDIFGNDILIRSTLSNDGISTRQMVKSRTELKKNGFDEGCKVEPFKFYRDKGELFFEASIDDFDIRNQKRLTHILEERIERFPEDIQKLNVDVLCQKLNSSLNVNLKICARDFKWAVPIYNEKRDTIQYLLPYHINKSLYDVAELAVVIGKGQEYWEVMTVLDIEEAYMDAMVISVPACAWLEV